MERSEKVSSSEPTTDDSEKKDKKSSKKRVSHVPLPLEAAEVQEREQRRTQELIDAAESDKPTKKKKRRRRRKSPEADKPQAQPEATEEKTEADAQPDQKEKAEAETSVAEEAEHGEIPVEGAETAEVPLDDGGYQGELLVSERARRQRMRRSSTEASASEPQTREADAAEQTHEQPVLDPVDAPRTEVSQSAEESEGDRAATPRELSAESHEPPRTRTPETADAADSDGGNEPPEVIRRRGFSAFNPFNRETPPTATATAGETVPEIRRDRTAERRHLVTGLIVGGLIEHVRHRRREKRMAKEQGKEITKLEVMASRTKTTLERQIERLQVEVQETKERLQETSKELMARPKETVAERPSVEVAPKPEPPTPAELDIKSAREKLEQAIAAQEAEQQEVEIPDDRRVMTSAWHRIEVDKRTGRAVETPVLAYGEEFKKEQHQEQLRREIEAANMAAPAMNQQPGNKKISSGQEDDAETSDEIKGEAPVRQALNKVTHTARSLPIEPIDIILWIILFIIIGTIINLLNG